MHQVTFVQREVGSHRPVGNIWLVVYSRTWCLGTHTFVVSEAFAGPGVSAVFSSDKKKINFLTFGLMAVRPMVKEGHQNVLSLYRGNRR